MTHQLENDAAALCDPEESSDRLEHEFDLSRRGFVQVLGAGLVIAVGEGEVSAQRRGERGGGRPRTVSARLHIGDDGTITVLTGKVEMGQGARAELTQAAAEELRVPVSRIQLVMGDTSLVPDDGITAGSRTTPSTVPAVRQGAAAGRQLLVALACQRWGVEPAAVAVRDGQIVHAASQRTLAYAELARSCDAAKALAHSIPEGVTLTPVAEWRVLGTSVPRPSLRDLVTGAHQFPSDLSRPGMLYGKVLRAPSYGAELTSVDLSPAKALREEMRFAEGRLQNASFGDDLVPRFEGVPKLDVYLLNRPDLPSVGGGETPIIAIAPAIGNAVHHAIGTRLREMPLRL